MTFKFEFPKKEAYRHDFKQALSGMEARFGSLDAVILTSKDPFLSEYVPVQNNPRYGITHFTGSVGDAVYFTEKFRKNHPGLKPVALFVDGRYHLQADNETNPEYVEVKKLDVEPNLENGVRNLLAQYPGITIGLDFERTSVSGLARYQEFAKAAGSEIQHISGPETLAALSLPGWTIDRPVYSLKETDTGRTPAKLFQALQEAMKKSGGVKPIHATAATDDAAFLLNARGYHLPHTASFLAYTFLVGDELILFLPQSSKDCPVNIDPSQLGSYQLKVIRDSLPELKSALSRHEVSHVFLNESSMNALLPSLLKEVFPVAALVSDFKWVVKTRARKTEAEMNSIRDSFLRSSRAIAKTLRFGKAESVKRDLSEVELAEYLNAEFKKEGAVSLSFGTISGAGPHSAIVHYSTPSKTAFFMKGELALLDCGAYYENGFCTDTTRGFFAGQKEGTPAPQGWQKDIYTTTLKSAIQVFIKPVDATLSGKDVDTLIRSKVKDAGYDYMHGTGHGIGIHVHEDGIRLSTLSTYPQSEYACVSVEPGIYLKDKGGVRVENVALLHPEGNRFRYENVVFVGYDWDLIDVTKLTDEEKSYLKAYEAECARLGTTLTECPL